MSEVEIFCLPGCKACSQAIAEYNGKGHSVTVYHVMEDKEATALADYRGIMNECFPVIYIDGERVR